MKQCFTMVVLALFALATPVRMPAQASQSAHQLHAADPGSHSADEIWNELVAGNQRFVSGKNRTPDHVSERQRLVKGQQPRVAVLACSDSRVAPEILFDQGLGALFVVRTAGNSADPMGIGSLEYAVEHLGTSVIVVLGHQSCGAVIAACSGGKMPTPNLEAVVRPIAPSCQASGQGEDKIDLAVRDHAQKTGSDLLTHSELLRHTVKEGKLTIIDAYYRLDTGVVTRLSK
jgi:carbonic anhydrase